MHKELDMSTVPLSWVIKSSTCVAIRSGEDDDAYSYVAKIGPRAGAGSLVVIFHHGARMLERVRLLGAITVVTEFSLGKKYFGELTKPEKSPLDEPPFLILTIHEEITESINELRFVPIT